MRVLVPYLISDALLISSSVAETDQPEWVSDTSYAADTLVMRASRHRVYRRITAGGGTTPPEADTTVWQDIGPTSRWAMFDGAVGTATTASGSISVSLAIPGPTDDVVLLGVAGSSVSVTAPGASRTVSVSNGIARISGLGAGAGTMQITVSGGSSVAVGSCLVGTYSDLGEVIDRAQLGIVDKSRKEFDAWGRPELVRRSFQRRQQFPFVFDTSAFDAVAGALAAVRSQAVLWEGVPWLDATVIYGLCRDWSLTRSSADKSRGTVTIESLSMGVAS